MVRTKPANVLGQLQAPRQRIYALAWRQRACAPSPLPPGGPEVLRLTEVLIPAGSRAINGPGQPRPSTVPIHCNDADSILRRSVNRISSGSSSPERLRPLAL